MNHPLGGGQRRESSLADTFGARGRIGAHAELRFESDLVRFAASRLALTDHSPFHAHSFDIPSGIGDRKHYRGDVDFAIASGNRLVLIDVKRWRTGVYWSLPIGFIVSGFLSTLASVAKGLRAILPHAAAPLRSPLSHVSVVTQRAARTIAPVWFGFRGFGAHVDEKFCMSRNMEAALEKYREALGGDIVVSAVVVFVPERATTDEPNVWMLRWPGGISSLPRSRAWDELHARLGAGEPPDPRIVTLLVRLNRNVANERNTE